MTNIFAHIWHTCTYLTAGQLPALISECWCFSAFAEILRWSIWTFIIIKEKWLKELHQQPARIDPCGTRRRQPVKKWSILTTLVLVPALPVDRILFLETCMWLRQGRAINITRLERLHSVLCQFSFRDNVQIFLPMWQLVDFSWPKFPRKTTLSSPSSWQQDAQWGKCGRIDTNNSRTKSNHSNDPLTQARG